MIPSICYAQLPAAGLGNRLLVWARAMRFAHLNALPLLVSSWEHAQLKRRLRRDADQRRYGDFFINPSALSTWQRWRILHSPNRIIEPPLEWVPPGKRAPLYIFNQMPHWSDYFKDIKEERELVKNGINAMLAPAYRNKIASLEPPCIGVHVRLGDFRSLLPGEDFAHAGQTRTPLDYFENLISGIRETNGSLLPVTVFSDGRDDELEPLLRLPGVNRATPNAAILDLLLLAKSRLIIAASSSTFSAWAGFLADAPLLLHPDHIYAPVRPETVNQQFFEGGVRGPASSWPTLLRTNIEAINW